MKIGLVFDDSLDSTDGVAQYVLALGDWLTSQGHKVHYLVGETHRTDLPNLHSLSRNVRVTFNGNKLGMPLPAPLKPIKKLLATEQFDVLHVMMPYSPLLAGRILHQAPASVRIVGTFHIAPYSGLATLGAKLLGIWCRPTLRRFNQVVSVSSAAKEFTRKTFGIDSKVVPNMFDYATFAGAKPMPDLQKPTIVFLGRLVARKGCQKLLEAAAQLAKNGQEFQLIVCGDGELRGQLENYVRANQLEKQVTFAGRVPEADKARYLASSDISVFPSSSGESFGIVLLEAMASGQAAVLGGDNPGYRTVLGGNPELLFPATDSQALAQKIMELLHNAKKQKELAAWGQQEAKKYDKAVVGPQILELYKMKGA